MKKKPDDTKKTIVIPQIPISEVKCTLKGQTSLLWNPPATVLEDLKKKKGEKKIKTPEQTVRDSLAFMQLKKNGDFDNFIRSYQAQLDDQIVKDISDRTLEFTHYLKCVQRELTNPTRQLAERLEERIKDTYDRFSDLVV